MNTLKGIFDYPKAPKRNFILENMKQIRTMKKFSDRAASDDSVPRKVNNYPHVTAKVSTHLNSNFRTKEGSATEMADTCRNGYVSNRNTANSDSSSFRNRPQQFSKTQQRFTKASKSRKPQGISLPISNSFENTDVYGENNSKIFDMMSNVSTVPLTRSASLLDASSHHIKPEERFRSSVSEHQIFTDSVRSLGCQTVPTGDMDRILNEGVIKYPSTWSIETNPSEFKVQRKSSRPTTCDSALQTEIASDMENFFISNSKPISSERALPPNDEVSRCKRLQNVFHSDNGSAFNEEQIDEKLRGVSGRTTFSQGHWWGRLRKEKQYPDSGEPRSTFSTFEDVMSGDSQCCPEGHIFLPEIERTETLRMLQKSYEEHIKELNSLPVKTDTLKMRQRKIDLERQLNKIEDGIKIFSRPKVIVKVGV